MYIECICIASLFVVIYFTYVASKCWNCECLLGVVNTNELILLRVKCSHICECAFCEVCEFAKKKGTTFILQCDLAFMYLTSNRKIHIALELYMFE